MGLGDQHGPVVIGDDNVIGIDRHAAAADRLLPVDEGQAGDGGRCGDARAPDRKPRFHHTRNVAHHAIRDQRRDAASRHARAQDIAENTGVRDAHGIDHADHAVRHGLDGGTGRFGR